MSGKFIKKCIYVRAVLEMRQPLDGFNPVESLGPSIPVYLSFSPFSAFQGNFIILKFNLEQCDYWNNLGDL